jgi:hypothetical protein
MISMNMWRDWPGKTCSYFVARCRLWRVLALQMNIYERAIHGRVSEVHKEGVQCAAFHVFQEIKSSIIANATNTSVLPKLDA